VERSHEEKIFIQPTASLDCTRAAGTPSRRIEAAVGNPMRWPAVIVGKKSGWCHHSRSVWKRSNSSAGSPHASAADIHV